MDPTRERHVAKPQTMPRLGTRYWRNYEKKFGQCLYGLRRRHPAAPSRRIRLSIVLVLVLAAVLISGGNANVCAQTNDELQEIIKTDDCRKAALYTLQVKTYSECQGLTGGNLGIGNKMDCENHIDVYNMKILPAYQTLQKKCHAAKTKLPDSADAFLRSVGCSVLPMGTCDLLNADNARNIMLTHRAILASHFCGTTNFNAAKQLLQLGDATNPDECRALLDRDLLFEQRPPIAGEQEQFLTLGCLDMDSGEPARQPRQE